MTRNVKGRNKRYQQKIKEAELELFKTVLLCNTEISVDASVAIARALSYAGINSGNYLLFLTMLETNNSYVVNALVGSREAFLLFTPIKPNWFMIKETFRMLARFKRDEIYSKTLQALLGIIQNAYKTSKYGYKVYPLNVSDVYNIGKHLDKSNKQETWNNRIILEVLDDIYKVGIDSGSKTIKEVGIKANSIRMSYFDDTKQMADSIPNVLLLSDAGRSKEIRPKYLADQPKNGTTKRKTGQK
ncbi:MAG: hypothetical protein AB1798_18625 [Spirochaetota bacterium]